MSKPNNKYKPSAIKVYTDGVLTWTPIHNGIYGWLVSFHPFTITEPHDDKDAFHKHFYDELDAKEVWDDFVEKNRDYEV